MYTYVFIWIYTHICVYVFTHIHMHTYIHIHIYIFIYVHTYKYGWACATPRVAFKQQSGGIFVCVCAWERERVCLYALYSLAYSKPKKMRVKKNMKSCDFFKKSGKKTYECNDTLCYIFPPYFFCREQKDEWIVRHV